MLRWRCSSCLVSFHRPVRPLRLISRLPESARFLSTKSGASSGSKSASKPPATWERSAKMVKNTDVTNPYLERVRSEVVDPALQLKTIEDELCGAIGKALGRQGDKILFAIREMQQELDLHERLSREGQLKKADGVAARYNKARSRAIEARWELLVHRQAVGFTVDNHSVVHSMFPIGDRLPEDASALETDDAKSTSDNSKDTPSTNKEWTDQLDWWQRIGRWR
ncbi:hypothetical protein THAOC_31078 [Thalassiosira oceanica]|uniref:Uncharacterized protein n=1 Tax=Thalassiosira oceanica TaxID=159749 RepID=K0RTH3_THAOC|nr:hypothetical protein THAOC_31078 [Thalassiosira oceanica]|mmetsp:Transcript_6588/g.13960  ORF Transcript_6588/g.13960 Transcript_6588/m.13960 type:complete len:224 (+) Transcript_6588:1-672(+)|eukprot:EJK49992.1 hypothetical protein THAOC_31078 [Thalassiosira oceanica]